ncbi:PDZ and LIM domain protein 5-like [Triplophysa rosa]|uniref:PDZ and LIM domain protein 5-like n=1 Tax=Triplophysa rosa TaxID=992332 RepID=UPI0025462FD9|nr:PDZ and LIM domain protein 5-like [Triplophysa rosa]
MEALDKGEALYEELYHEGKHGLRVENMPCFIPNDRSKKRLIEDTEDWQPRTGTTQSRSFRILAQLTGTDFSKTDSLRPQPGSAASALGELLPLIWGFQYFRSFMSTGLLGKKQIISQSGLYNVEKVFS